MHDRACFPRSAGLHSFNLSHGCNSAATLVHSSPRLCPFAAIHIVGAVAYLLADCEYHCQSDRGLNHQTSNSAFYQAFSRDWQTAVVLFPTISVSPTWIPLPLAHQVRLQAMCCFGIYDHDESGFLEAPEFSHMVRSLLQATVTRGSWFDLATADWLLQIADLSRWLRQATLLMQCNPESLKWKLLLAC